MTTLASVLEGVQFPKKLTLSTEEDKYLRLILSNKNGNTLFKCVDYSLEPNGSVLKFSPEYTNRDLLNIFVRLDGNNRFIGAYHLINKTDLANVRLSELTTVSIQEINIDVDYPWTFYSNTEKALSIEHTKTIKLK